ncbi:YcxB family protein [Brucellaceae bacterium D45D]
MPSIKLHKPGVVLMIGALWIATAILTLCELTYLDAPRQTRKIFKQQKNLHKPYTLTRDGDRRELTSEAGNARLSRNDLLKMRKDSKIMLFYESEQLYRLIPKRSLTQDQIAPLRQSWLTGHG